MTVNDADGSRSRLLFIDALRGVAACSVMAHHFVGAISPERQLALPDIVDAALHLGEGGVQIFFVLSGFVIAANLEGLARLSPAVVGRFMLRRSIRLDPVYWLAIALNAAFILTLSTTDKASALGPASIVANMFYVNGILAVPPGFIVPVGWTLAFELQFYLALAVLLLVCRATARESVRVVVFWPLLVVSVLVALDTVPVRVSPWALAAWHMFFLGVVCCWLHLKRPLASSHVAVALIASTAVVAITREAVTVLALGTAIAILWAVRTNRLTWAIGGAPLQWLGKLSYSLYLVHPFVGNKLLRFFHARIPEGISFGAEQALRWILLAVAVVATLACSWLVWRLVEKPAQRLARRVALG